MSSPLNGTIQERLVENSTLVSEACDDHAYSVKAIPKLSIKAAWLEHAKDASRH